MIYFAIFLTFFLGFILAISGGIVYFITIRTLSPQVAKNSLKYFFICSLFAIAVTFFFSFISRTSFGNYVYLGFAASLATIVSMWLLTWNQRKKSAGNLELNVGRLTPEHRLIYWIGVLMAFSASTQTFILIRNIFDGRDLIMQLAIAIILWTSTAIIVALGLTQLQFRSNGICYMFTTILWNRVNYFYWDNVITNILTLRLERNFLFFPKLWSLAIPIHQKDTVNHILASHIPTQ